MLFFQVKCTYNIEQTVTTLNIFCISHWVIPEDEKEKKTVKYHDKYKRNLLIGSAK